MLIILCGGKVVEYILDMVNKFRKYFTVIGILARNCFSKDTAYRLPFMFWIVANLLWFEVGFYSVDLLFNQIHIVAGWTQNEARLLVVIHQMFITSIWIFIMPNLVIFWRLVSQGTLDFHLIKPVSARFLVSMTYFEFDMIPRFVPALIIFAWLLRTSLWIVSWDMWLIFILVFILGMIIFYNFAFMIVLMCFWFTKIDALEDFFNAGISIGKYPADIFKGVSKIVFVYVFPTIFMAAIPAMVILGKGKIELLAFCIIFAIASSFVSQWFWNFALKHYSSASS